MYVIIERIIMSSNTLHKLGIDIGSTTVKVAVLDENDKLSLTQDPKILAAKNMNIFPVEINSAPLVELIRVPGIGIKSARHHHSAKAA